jgi:hypothetical protein
VLLHEGDRVASCFCRFASVIVPTNTADGMVSNVDLPTRTHVYICVY